MVQLFILAKGDFRLVFVPGVSFRSGIVGACPVTTGSILAMDYHQQRLN